MGPHSLQRPRLMSRGTWARLSQAKSSGHVLAQPSFSSDVMEPPAPGLLSNSFSSRSEVIEPPGNGLLGSSFSSKSDIIGPYAPGLSSNSVSSISDIMEPPAPVLLNDSFSSKSDIMESPAQVLLSKASPGLLSNSLGQETEPAPSLSVT